MFWVFLSPFTHPELLASCCLVHFCKFFFFFFLFKPFVLQVIRINIIIRLLLLLHPLSLSRRVILSQKIVLNSNGEVNCRELARGPWC